MICRPIGAEVVLTHRCNHLCIHCYDPFSQIIEAVTSDLDDRCTRVLDQMHLAGIRKVILTGGEPLLVPDILEYMLIGAYSRQIEVSLNTNLTMVDESFLDLIESFDPQPFILTSLPSVDPKGCDRITGVPGSFDRIMEGISACNSRGIQIGVNIVATGYSEYDAERIDALLESYHNIVYLAISPVIPQHCRVDDPFMYLDDEGYRRIDSILKHVSDRFGIAVGSTTPLPMCITGFDRRTREHQSMCSAGRLQCVVDLVTGSVFACAHSDRSYGNIYKESLLDAWERMGEWRDDSLLSKECRACPSRSYCGGECRMMSSLSRKLYTLDGNYVADVPSPPPLDRFARYRVSDRLVVRDDGETGVLFFGSNSYMMVRKSVLALIKFLRGVGTFAIADIEDSVRIDDFFITSFRNLVDIGIIEGICESGDSE